MEVWLSLIDATPTALGFVLYDIFHYFSWWVYLGSALIYTALVFSGELSKDGPLSFPKPTPDQRNSSSLFTSTS